MTRSIVAMTGTRADYGIYRPVFQALTDTPTVSLGLIVTGMHLRPAFGHTVDLIKADGFHISADINSLTDDDSPLGQSAYISDTLRGCAELFQKDRPDIVLVLGDRGEQLAATIAAVEAGIPVAHLHGGEESGGIDNAVRHAITQLASLHLTSTEDHAATVRRMIGKDQHVHVVGAPALDVIASLPFQSKEALCTEVGFDPALPLLLFVQHPDTLEVLSPENQLRPSLDALATFPGNILVLGANADTGGLQFNAGLQDFVNGDPRRRFSISLAHTAYLHWLQNADVLVGNSSSGIIEAASFHIPVVNIGNRQQGRTRSGNVIDAPYNAGAITEAINTALHNQSFRDRLHTSTNVYGDGHSAEKIMALLSAFPLQA